MSFTQSCIEGESIVSSLLKAVPPASAAPVRAGEVAARCLQLEDVAMRRTALRAIGNIARWVDLSGDEGVRSAAIQESSVARRVRASTDTGSSVYPYAQRPIALCSKIPRR